MANLSVPQMRADWQGLGVSAVPGLAKDPLTFFMNSLLQHGDRVRPALQLVVRHPGVGLGAGITRLHHARAQEGVQRPDELFGAERAAQVAVHQHDGRARRVSPREDAPRGLVHGLGVVAAVELPHEARGLCGLEVALQDLPGAYVNGGQADWQGYRYTMHEFHHDEHRIWGATAAITLQLLDLLALLAAPPRDPEAIR